MAADTQVRLRVAYGDRSSRRSKTAWPASCWPFFPCRVAATAPQQWKAAIAHAAWVFRGCAHQGIALELLNLGRGFPAYYREAVSPLAAYAEAIDEGLTKEFGAARPNITVEPGRHLVGDAGLLPTEILLISRKSTHEPERWIYLDAGIYNGLDEALNERIHYHIRTPHEGGLADPQSLPVPPATAPEFSFAGAPMSYL